LNNLALSEKAVDLSEERIVRGSITFNDNVANTDRSTPRLCLMPICKGQVSPLKMGRVGCPETSVRNCRSTLHKIPKDLRPFLSGAQIKKNEMGIYGVEDRCTHGFLDGELERRRPLGRRKRSWGIILKWIFMTWDGKDNVQRTFGFPKMCRIYGLAGEIVFSRRTLLLGVG
jgi:hypothetical protein